MKHFIRTLSPTAEFTVVLLLAFGSATLNSILIAATPVSGAAITEARLHYALIYEVAVFICLGSFLAIRGWSVRDFGLPPTARDACIGIGLAIAAYCAYIILWIVTASFIPGLSRSAVGLVATDLRWSTVLAMSLINPLYEEVFVCGYVINRLADSRCRFSPADVSVGIRLTYHLYQGLPGVILVVPLGIIFGHWYARTHRLWPVVTAHAILDLVGLWPYVRW